MHGLCAKNYWLVLIVKAFQCDTGHAVAPRLACSCVTCEYVFLSLLHNLLHDWLLSANSVLLLSANSVLWLLLLVKLLLLLLLVN